MSVRSPTRAADLEDHYGPDLTESLAGIREAKADLADAIAAAYEAGLSYRRIGRILGMTGVGVAKFVDRTSEETDG